jgi:Family of unknown function (DUF6527)
MSDAKVTFYTLDHEEAAPGQEQLFAFACPTHDRQCFGLHIAGQTSLPRDGQNQNGGVEHWDWDGNREKPTFSPSVNCQKCWHGYIRAGRCVDVNGRDEPEPQKGSA